MNKKTCVFMAGHARGSGHGGGENGGGQNRRASGQYKFPINM